MEKLKILRILEDKKINAKVIFSTIKLKNYLYLVEKEEGGELEIQRTFLGFKLYKKLISDILQGAVVPNLSVICNDFSIDEKNNLLEINGGFLILDGLQRTYCFKIAIDILVNKENSKYYDSLKDSIRDFEPIFETKDDFLENYEIGIEVWTNMDLPKTLYKMVVLNTGQKKMSLQHQLDILSIKLGEILNELGLKSITEKEIRRNKFKTSEIEKEGIIKLHSLAEAVVSYIKGSPVKNKQDAVEYLFERLDVFENLLSKELIDDIEFVFKKLHPNFRYCDDKKEDGELHRENCPYILSKYDPVLIGLFAAIGRARGSGNFEERISKLEKERIDWDKFFECYKEFKTGIGTKRRRFAFELFRGFLLGNFESIGYKEIDEIYSFVQ